MSHGVVIGAKQWRDHDLQLKMVETLRNPCYNVSSSDIESDMKSSEVEIEVLL